MGIQTEKFIRKPLYVDAVRVTAENFDALVEWCDGKVQTETIKGKPKKFIKVRVQHPKFEKQTQAFVGDWVLYTDTGYKIYTNRAFLAQFDPVPPEPEDSITAVAEQRLRADKEVLDDLDPQVAAEVRKEAIEVPQSMMDDYNPVDAEVTRQITEAQLHSVGPVAADPSPETGVGEIQAVEVVEATPQAIADVVNEQQPVETDTPGVAVSGSTTAPPAEVNGKRVLTYQDQKEMTHAEVQTMLRAGEAILVQDLVA